MKNEKAKKWGLIFLAVIAVMGVASFSSAMGRAVFGPSDFMEIKPDQSFAIMSIQGTIQGSNSGSARTGYDHSALMDYVDELIEDETNTGIFLDVNSGGGTVYHSDEFYNKLMEYKEETGRPVQAYFGSMAASGAYYISCAADYISANKNCWTGSIGVIISMTNVKELYEKLGIQEILITSGENKGMGSAGGTLTPEQYAIYQSLVDESYEDFVQIVAKGRNLPLEQVKTIADGRVYTAKQALDIDLIDEISTYEQALEKMKEDTQSEGYYRTLYVPTLFETLFSNIKQATPKSDLQTLKEMADNQLSGVPLYLYQGAY